MGPPPRRVLLSGALLSLLYLVGGLAVAFPVTGLLSDALPGAMDRLGHHFFVAVLAGCALAAGALWARHLARALGLAIQPRLLLGGAAGFGLSAPAVVAGLSAAETYLLRQAQAGSPLPMHLAFGALFTGGVLLVVGSATMTLGVGAGLGRRAAGLALRCGGAAALAFLAVDLLMDAAGWRVGAPGAEARATMMVVFALGLLAATSVGGAVLARSLAASPPRAAGSGPWGGPAGRAGPHSAREVVWSTGPR